MRLTWKDGRATLIVGAAVALYASFAAGVDMPLVGAPRVLAAVILALGLAACIVGGADIPTLTPHRKTDIWVGVLVAFGVVAFLAAVVTMITGSELVLAILIGEIVAMWLLTTIRHAIVGSGGIRVTDTDIRRMMEQPTTPGRRHDQRQSI